MARNLYAGYCYKCGKYVPVGLGYFERIKGKARTDKPKWRVQCMKCCNGREPDENESIVKRARAGKR